jgi:hypothetical protein
MYTAHSVCGKRHTECAGYIGSTEILLMREPLTFIGLKRDLK